MPKRIKMTRKKRQELVKDIGGWLEHKAKLRRKKEEKSRNCAAVGLNKIFMGYAT